MNQTLTAWQIEQANREHYRQANPALLEPPFRHSSQAEAALGIGNLPAGRPAAYWRLLPSDYLIEESARGRQVFALPSQASPEIGQSWLLGKLLADDRHSSAAAAGFLYRSLGLEPGQVGLASRREAECLSAQAVTLPAAAAGALGSLAWPPGLLAGDWRPSQSPLTAADLEGNGFTVVLRTKEPVQAETFALRLELLSQYGVLNYFPENRFGSRLNYQELGRLLLSGQLEAAVRAFLCQTGGQESLLLTRLREVAAASYPNYDKLLKIFGALPVTFKSELQIVTHLKDQPDDWAGALLSEAGQARQWLFAYGAWLYNRRLTAVSEKNGITTERLAWPLSPDPLDTQGYRAWLEADEVNLAGNPFLEKLLPLKKQALPGRFRPRQVAVKAFPGGLALYFELSGSHAAATLLANLFDLASGRPLPEWVEEQEVDPKQLLGQGALRPALSVLSNPTSGTDNPA